MHIISRIRYFGAAALLKAFSSSSISRQAYRTIGNSFFAKRHAQCSSIDVSRAFWLYNAIRAAGFNATADSAFLELGSGWTHFYAIFLRMLFPVKISLYDIRDNRQIEALKMRISLLYQMISSGNLNLTLKERSSFELANSIKLVHDYDELYKLLDMEYIVNAEGRLDIFCPESFNLIFSVDVLEHVKKAELIATISYMHRNLKKNGLSVHQIGLDDHLTHYAPGMCSKQYLAYSDLTWENCFNNELQYINRVQSDEFLEAFKNSGFELLHISYESDLSISRQIAIHKQYQQLSESALQATRMNIVHRKL
jgi:hypothetical protein